jgi:hypothetical protein
MAPDPAIIDVYFCGKVAELRTYKGVIGIGVVSGRDTLRTTFQVFPNPAVPYHERGSSLFWDIAVGDSLCKDSGATAVLHGRNGEWHEWEIHL